MRRTLVVATVLLAGAGPALAQGRADALRGLPVHAYAPPGAARGGFVFLSGDGGWRSFDRANADSLRAGGWFVLGVDAMTLFSREVSGDSLAALVRLFVDTVRGSVPAGAPVFVRMHRNVVARISFANVPCEGKALSLRICLRRRELVVNAIKIALAIRGGNRLDGILIFKMVVGAVVVGQIAIIVAGDALDRRAAQPAADEAGADHAWAARGQRIGHTKMVSHRLQERVQGKHVLPQPPEDKERAIPGPARTGVHDGPRLFHGLVRILSRVTKHEFPRPQHVLARLALIAILGILAHSQHVVRIIRETPANARLRDPVEEPKMLVARQRGRQVRAFLFEDDMSAAGCAGAIVPAKIPEAVFNALDFGKHVFPVVAGDNYDHVGRLITRASYHPIFRTTLQIVDIASIAQVFRAHGVRVHPGSRLDEIVGGQDLRINSFHHQAIKDLGHGLEVAAVADDGVIEAIEAEDRSWVIGVQWHPERHEATAPDSDPDRRLFGAFRQAVFDRAKGDRRA